MSGCLVYLKDWPRHGGAEPLGAIQRKREAGFLQSHKEEKEKIPNGNLSRSCPFAVVVLAHASCTVCPLCILNLLLPNFSTTFTEIWSHFFVCLSCVMSPCHESRSSVLQMQVPEGRPPATKKSLFPLFSPKNSIKHRSSVRALPVVSSFMVHAVLHSPAHLQPSYCSRDIACVDNIHSDFYF